MNETTDRGQAVFGGNELMVDSIIDDPPKVRQGSPSGSFGCVSGDRIQNGVRKEKTLLILKPDDSGGEGGCYDFFAQRPGTEDDANMVRVARITTDAFEVFVPLVLHAGGAQPAPVPGPEPTPAPTPDPVPGDIPEGDFAAVARHYGFPSDDEQPYREGRLTWAEVIARMDRRAA